MEPSELIDQLRKTQDYFARSTSALTDDDGDFAPTEELMTTAQQVAHVAQTIDWFFDGASRPEGFDMNFEAHMKAVMKVASLAAAREWLAKSFDAGAAFLESKTAEELAEPLPEGPVMGGDPIRSIVRAIADHTAHHRGVLTVYARLRGHVPPMPYM